MDQGSTEPPTTETVKVRPATEADLATVVALDEQVTGMAKPDYFHDLFERYTGQPREQGFFLVADGGDGRPLGFIIGEVRSWEFGSSPCGWIFAVDVEPDVRLGGIGDALLDAICERFRETGVKKIRTMLSRDNHQIMSFFRSHGMMAGPYIQLEMELD